MKNLIILALCAFTASQIKAMNFKEEYLNFKGESFRFTPCGSHCPKTTGNPFMWLGEEGWDQIVVNNKDNTRIAEISFGSPNGPHKCHLGLLNTLSTYRNRGIGKELFNRAIERMINDGCRTIEWSSLPDAIPFYKKIGIPDTAFTNGIDPERHGAYIRYQVPFERLKNPTWSEKMKHKFHERFK